MKANVLHGGFIPAATGRIPDNKRIGDSPHRRSNFPTIEPLTTMNPNPSQPTSDKDDELTILQCLGATALVVGACASIAVTFAAIGTCYAADAAIKRIFRKGDRHVPR